MRNLLAAIILLTGLGPAFADDSAGVIATVSVTAPRDDGTLALEDGRTAKLAGIEIARGREGKDAREALAEMTASGPVTIRADGAASDRYGNIVGQAYATDGRWIQGELLRHGLARVATAPDHRDFAHDLLMMERKARARKLGLWRDPDYALRNPRQAARLVDSWQVVEGIVVDTHRTRGDVYLEFGDDRTRDLAVRVPNEVADQLSVDAESLTGRRIRVRGWIGKSIGPVIALNHVEQLELLRRSHGEREAEAQ